MREISLQSSNLFLVVSSHRVHTFWALTHDAAKKERKKMLRATLIQNANTDEERTTTCIHVRMLQTRCYSYMKLRAFV